MIKDCKVTINNDVVTCFIYDDVDVQAPAINRKAETVKADHKGDLYYIVDENTTQKPAPADKEQDE